MRVKTVRDHNNRYGLGEEGIGVAKKEGDHYTLPDTQAETLIAAGLVEEAKAAKAAKAEQGTK
jgi:hypothetical protein